MIRKVTGMTDFVATSFEEFYVWDDRIETEAQGCS
jgi:hypothetical protein